jgi:hypothetical protein
VGLGAAFAVVVGGGVAGCGDSDGGTGGTTSATGSGSTSTGSGSNSSSSSSSSSGGGACEPGASCMAADKECIGLVDNSGQSKFGLRIAELTVTSPPALTKGIIQKTVADAVTPALTTCNLKGGATFSWLLQFDKSAGTLKTGGAKPVIDPTTGYSFDDEIITSGGKMFHVQPVVYSGVTPDAAGQFDVTTGTDALVPVFLDAGATQAIILPLKQLRFRMGTLSSNQNCIGKYNAAGLDPSNSCQPDDTHPQFITGASLDGVMTLEDADTVVVAALSQSLCVLLSGNAAMYGMQGMNNVTVCKRDAGSKIVYQGGWCSATNTAGGCADAEQLQAQFAASSVKINN